MLYIALVIFSIIYSSSAITKSRLLLQWPAIPPQNQPMFIPAQPPAVTDPAVTPAPAPAVILPVMTPAPVTLPIPVMTPAPVILPIPVMTPAPVASPAVLPAQPSAPAPPQYPAQPSAPAPPQYPANPAPYTPTNPPATPPYLECKLSPPNPASCAGKMATLTNIPETFDLTCSAYQSCANSMVNFNFDQWADPRMEFVKGLWFDADYAAAGAIINFNNQRPGNKIRIMDIVCDKPYSCMNTQIILVNMEIYQGDIKCGDYTSCQGCVIKENPFEMGVPCTDYTI